MKKRRHVDDGSRSSSKTIARPNFREIADYTSFEFVGDFVYIGNPSLRRTTIKNYDLRWEWFPRRGVALLQISAPLGRIQMALDVAEAIKR
mgnify:CR=1 FL=1